MGTQSSSLRPPPDPARSALVDPKTGMLTHDGFWFLYLLFRGAQFAEGTAILEAIDTGTESTLTPAIQDLMRAQVSYLGDPPLVTKAQLEEVMKAVQLEQSQGVTQRQLEEVRTLGITEDPASILPRLLDLERLVAIGEQFPTQQSLVLVGTHAQRLAYTPTEAGQLWWETDRTVMYISADSSGIKWFYSSGTYSDVLANIPTDLVATTDVGFLFGSTDYWHTWRWAGTQWHYAPGDSGAGYIVATIALPTGGAWGLCTGGAYSVTTDAGGLASVTTPDLTADVFIRGGVPLGQQAASRPTWEAAARTDGESAHTHAVSGTTDPVGDHAHTIATTPVSTAIPGAGSPDVVTSPTGNAGAHDHTYGTISASGTVHSHPLSDANAQLKVPSDANGGVPLRISVYWYMRL